MWYPNSGYVRPVLLLGAIIAVGEAVAMAAAAAAAAAPTTNGVYPSDNRIRTQPLQNREDRDLLAMRDVNTNFLYTLVCDNSVSIDTRMARYQCLLNRIAPLDRSAVLKCVQRFDLRSSGEFISAFCRGRLGCRRFRYCIAREREALMEMIGTTSEPTMKQTENSALITSEPISLAISTSSPSPPPSPTTTTITSTTTAPSTAATPTTSEATTIGETTMVASSIVETKTTTEDAAETGRGDSFPPQPSFPPTSQPLQPEQPFEPADEDDDYFPCLCAKKAKYLKRSSKASRQGRSVSGPSKDDGRRKQHQQMLFSRQQRQREPANLIFPLGVVRQCLIEFGDHSAPHTSVGSTSSLRRYYASIFRPF